MRRAAVLLAIAIGPGLSRPGAVFARDSAAVPARRPNVIMIVIDTLRADHLSAYGYKKATTPNIDALARRGVVFESAYAQSDWTLPSFASFLTGKYPRSLGMFEEGKRSTRFDYVDPKLGDAETLLPQALQKAGYKTAAFITGRHNGPAYGFNRGYDLFRHYKSVSNQEKTGERSFATFLPEAFAWMEKNKDAPFFVLLHASELHRPYLPPEQFVAPFAGGYRGILASSWFSKNALSSVKKDGRGWFFAPDDSARDGDDSARSEVLSSTKPVVRLGQADLDYIAARYDASLHYADGFIGELDAWTRRATPDNTIVIVMADHGEGLGDHGLYLHCTDPPTLYQEIVHVPLIMSVPGGWLKTSAGSVRQPVELVDVMPTLLDLVRAPRPAGLEGKSLLGIMTGETKEDADRVVRAETLGYGLDVQSVKAGAWKLIRTRAPGSAAAKLELYDLASDPAEARDLAERKPEIVRTLLAQIDVRSARHEK